MTCFFSSQHNKSAASTILTFNLLQKSPVESEEIMKDIAICCVKKAEHAAYYVPYLHVTLACDQYLFRLGPFQTTHTGNARTEL